MDLIDWTKDGSMLVNFHPGQIRAWDSLKRFVCVFSGTQGGKTEMGPPWLLREIQLRGPGDYMIVTPTFPLLELKALPAFKHLFETRLKLGEYQGHPLRKFTFNDTGKKFCFGKDTDKSKETIIYFGHASDPESLESARTRSSSEPGGTCRCGSSICSTRPCSAGPRV